MNGWQKLDQMEPTIIGQGIERSHSIGIISMARSSKIKSLQCIYVRAFTINNSVMFSLFNYHYSNPHSHAIPIQLIKKIIMIFMKSCWKQYKYPSFKTEYLKKW